jgi:hypothetical protein
MAVCAMAWKEGLVAAFSIYEIWIVNCDARGDRVVWQFDEELGFGFMDGDEIAHR